MKPLGDVLSGIDIWAQIVARHTGLGLDREHDFGGNLFVSVDPVPDVLLLDRLVVFGYSAGQLSLRTGHFDRFFECFKRVCVHKREKYNSWRISSTGVVSFLSGGVLSLCT